MKVLLVTSCLDAGGAEKWCRDTFLSMNREDISIDYYFYEDIKKDSFLNDYKQAGVCLYFRELNKKVGGVKKNLKKDLRRFIHEHGPYQAAHINGLDLMHQRLLVNVLYDAGIPVRIVHSHSTYNTRQTPFANFAKYFIRRDIVRKATVVGACSTQAGIARYGSDIERSPKFVLLKNGINIDANKFNADVRTSIRTKLGITDQKVYTFIGRIAYPKNTVFLVEIFAAIHTIDPESVFIIVGSGQDEDITQQKILDLGIENSVLHIPWTDRPSDYLSASDVILLPSFYEGFPLVLLEAQSNGIPCLVSDRITREINITGEIAFETLNHSADQWAESAIKLSGKGRYNALDIVRAAGYDIKDSSAVFRELLMRIER